MVTGTGDDGESTNELVSLAGPGVEYHAGINNLVSRGAQFRMLEVSGEVLFSGYSVRECTECEPLEEFGRDRGRSGIECERKGNCVALLQLAVVRGIIKSLGKMSLILILAGTLTSVWSQSGEATSLLNTIDAIQPSIIAVGTILPTCRLPGAFLVTGFVVSDGRHIITNAHAIPDEFDYQNQASLAELVSKDSEHEVALLEIIKGRLPTMSLVDNRKVLKSELYAFTGFS